jgi:light-regulated signal transduction histidine kinase (bacteriophytochrome)
MTEAVGAGDPSRLPYESAQLQQENAQLQHKLDGALARIKQLQFTLAHDLRAPLRHVGAFVQVIREDHAGQLSTEVLAHLTTIEEAARKMGVILDAQQHL